MHQQALEDPKAEDAAIHVEDSRGAILLISGERDRMWPATTMGQQIIDRLEAHESDVAYEHLSFDAGHNWVIMNSASWRKIASFLEEHYA
jgi:hypothetical protein